MRTNSNMIVISNQLALRGLLCLVLALGTACTGNQPASGDQALGLNIWDGMFKTLTLTTLNNEQVSLEDIELSIRNNYLDLYIKLKNPHEKPVSVKHIKMIIWSGDHFITAHKKIDLTLDASSSLEVRDNIESKDLLVGRMEKLLQGNVTTILLILVKADGSKVITGTKNLRLQ